MWKSSLSIMKLEGLTVLIVLQPPLHQYFKMATSLRGYFWLFIFDFVLCKLQFAMI